MSTTPKASLPVIKRLPKYYRYLKTLRASGITSISSRELASQMGTTASQVRQDFNCFGDVNGRQGIGYSVDTLLDMLEKLLFGNGDRLPAILLGAGRLGKAVSRFITTDTNGYKLIAAFDASPDEIGKTISGIQIRSIDELESFCKENHPQVAVLCLPREGAQELSGRLIDLGIEGFWNFSHYDLSVAHPDVIVENVHLGDSLMSLGYRLRNQEG
jgi:redox-sensing transcriptional repressor